MLCRHQLRLNLWDIVTALTLRKCVTLLVLADLTLTTSLPENYSYDLHFTPEGEAGAAQFVSVRSIRASAHQHPLLPPSSTVLVGSFSKRSLGACYENAFVCVCVCWGVGGWW